MAASANDLKSTDSQRQGALDSSRVAATMSAGQASVSEIQKVSDSLIQRTFLWMFPRWIRPNHLTIVRFILTPVVLVLLYYHLRWWALAVFIVAVSTDFIDGAMARTRDQITPVGIVIDPIADKLLIGAVLAWLGYEQLVVQIILAFIALELVLMAVGLTIARPGKRTRPANVFGKSKMVVQSLALILFLVSGILELHGVFTFALYMLWVAIALAVLSGGRHVIEAIAALRKQR